MKNFTNQNCFQNGTKHYRTPVFFGLGKRYGIILLMFAAFASLPDRMYAQFVQQGGKLVGTGAIGSADQGFSGSISSDGNTAIAGGSGDNNSKGAAWIYTRTAGAWSQQGSKLVGKGAVGAYGPYQGSSVAISSDGNTAIVGGVGDNSFAGAAWIFIRVGGVWTQQGSKLTGTGATGNAQQGESVSISGDGNTAIVGGYDDQGGAGAVWVYTRTAGVWTQQGSKLVGTGNVGQGAGQRRSVSISSDGNTIITGGPGYGGEYNTIDAAWVFTRTGGVWTQQGKLLGTGAMGKNGVYQGTSVSISSDGNTAIVGGWKDNNGIGAAWVFTRSGGGWTQQGNKLTGTGVTGTGTRQGWSVSISSDGNKAIVGGSGDSNGIGAAWVYTRNGGVWTQQGNKLAGKGAVGSSNQGNSVSISSDGSTAIAGGPGDNSSAGAVWVYFTSKAPDVAQINPDIKNITGENTTGFMVYPNPATDDLTVEFMGSSDGNVKVNVYNLSGQKLMNIENPSIKGLNTFKLNISKLGTGFYIFEIENNGQKQHQKFLISRQVILS